MENRRNRKAEHGSGFSASVFKDQIIIERSKYQDGSTLKFLIQVSSPSQPINS